MYFQINLELISNKKNNLEIIRINQKDKDEQIFRCKVLENARKIWTLSPPPYDAYKQATHVCKLCNNNIVQEQLK